MISRLARLVAVTVPVLFALATPALAAPPISTPPEVLSLGISNCVLGEIVVTVDGAQPNSTLHVVITFTGAPVVTYDGTADIIGHFEASTPIPPNAGAIVLVNISGLDFDLNTPAGVPFNQTFRVDRRTCAVLPPTGANSAPIGKIAFGMTLAGAFLIVVTLRRRSRADRHDAPVAA